MTGQICTPLRIEQFAVGRGTSRTPQRIGRGPHGRPASYGPTILAGVAGGLDPRVRPGDLVVADQVRAPDGTRTQLASAPLLAGALRRAGLVVHVGTIDSTEHVVTGAERRRLATRGGLAVDTESAYFAQRVSPGQLAVVRAVVDTQESPLLRAGTVHRGLAALRSLGRAAPVLQQWADLSIERTVLLAQPRSFCAGVERAIEIVERALARYGAPVYVRRQIVHNTHVVAQLEQRGAVFVQELCEVPIGAVAVLAAHGVSPAVRDEAAQRELQVIDATCPLVTKVHAEVRRFAGAGHTVFLIGHADHEEVVGTRGEAPEHVMVVEDVQAAHLVDPVDPERVSYVMQTTLSVQEAERIAVVLRARFPSLAPPRRDDICYATTNRQHALRDVAADVDLVLVVGSGNSSNSRRLVEVAQATGTAAYLIEDASDVDLVWLAGVRRIGISAGASAPPLLVDHLLQALGSLGEVHISTRGAVTETIRFTLPRKVV